MTEGLYSQGSLVQTARLRAAVCTALEYGLCSVPSSSLATFAHHTPKARLLSSSAVALAFELRSHKKNGSMLLH